MPVTRCPQCGLRMLVAGAVLGQTVGCSRCERTFEAEAQTPAGRLGELLLVAAAMAVGVGVAWLMMKNH